MTRYPPVLHPIPVAPVAHDVVAFVNRGDDDHTVEFDHARYPQTEQGGRLRTLRVPIRMGLMETARHLGVSVVTYSGLERGTFTLPDDEWAGVFAWLESVPKTARARALQALRDPDPLYPRRVLFTGSRRWSDREAIRYYVDLLAAHCVVVHGACPSGLDAIVDELATARGLTVERHPADWSQGKKGGPLRNKAMVDLGADLCVAFPIGSDRGGTRDCMGHARVAGIPVFDATEETRLTDDDIAWGLSLPSGSTE